MKAIKFFIPAVAAFAVMAVTAACGGNKQNADSETVTDAEVASELVAETGTSEPAPVIGSSVLELTDNSTIAPASVPVIIDFNATWCPPCQRFKPIFHEVAEAYKDKFVFYSVDTDVNPAMAETYGITSIPTVAVLYPDGRIEKSEPGFMDKAEFEKFLAGVGR